MIAAISGAFFPLSAQRIHTSDQRAVGATYLQTKRHLAAGTTSRDVWQLVGISVLRR